MPLQNHLSTLALFLFFVLLGSRMLILWRKGIRAIVFGQTNKSDFLLVPLFLLIVYAVLARSFGLPMLAPLLKPFWDTPAPGWLGFALCTVGLCGVALTLISFGESFRVGIDEQKPDKLVTDGMFAISRNPIYVSFFCFISGLFLIHRNWLITVAVALFAIAIHRQVLREEAFLKKHYGDAYTKYCEKVRRYL